MSEEILSAYRYLMEAHSPTLHTNNNIGRSADEMKKYE